MIEIKGYVCEFCGRRGDKISIELCERIHKLQDSYFKKDNIKFELTNQHIKLLNRFVVNWSNCEYGAPEINPKRPYGNSFVEGDIAEILGIDGEVKDDGEKLLSDKQQDELYKIHLETKLALEIVLQFGEAKIGEYFRKRWIGGKWERIGDNAQ